MICTLTARRLKPGSFDAFRSDFESMEETAPKEILRRWTNVYVTRVDEVRLDGSYEVIEEITP